MMSAFANGLELDVESEGLSRGSPVVVDAGGDRMDFS